MRSWFSGFLEFSRCARDRGMLGITKLCIAHSGNRTSCSEIDLTARKKASPKFDLPTLRS